MWCWLLLVPTEQMCRNQSNLQSYRDSLIDLDCEIKGWLIRIELTISVSEDKINNQPETVSTNNKLFSSIDKKEPHLMLQIKCVRVYLDDKKPEQPSLKCGTQANGISIDRPLGKTKDTTTNCGLRVGKTQQSAIVVPFGPIITTVNGSTNKQQTTP